MNKPNRKEAKAQGLNKCYGSLCAKHPELEGFRWVSGSCFECQRVTLRKSRSSNPERTKAQEKKDWAKRMANPEQRAKKIAGNARYRKKCKDTVDAGIQRWRKANPDKVALYKENAKGKYKAQKNASTAMRRAALRLRTPGWLDVVDIAVMNSIYEYAAALRDCKLDYHVDHIVPLQSKIASGLHVPSNLQVIHAKDNLSKGNKLAEALQL